MTMSIPKYSQSLSNIAVSGLLLAVPTTMVQTRASKTMDTVNKYTAGALGKGWSYLKSHTFSYSTSTPDGGSSGGGASGSGETKSETGEATTTPPEDMKELGSP